MNKEIVKQNKKSVKVKESTKQSANVLMYKISSSRQPLYFKKAIKPIQSQDLRNPIRH